MTTAKKTLTDHLSDIMAEAGYVQKDAKNDHFKYKYASADAVLTKVREACSKRGVAVTQTTSELVQVVEHDKGALYIVRMSQTYSYGGESATFQGMGCGQDRNDKGIMKANTAALKYLLSGAFNISWGDDPEADSSIESQGGKAKPAARAKAKPTAKAKAAPPADTISGLLEKLVAAGNKDTIDGIRDIIVAERSNLSDAQFSTLKNATMTARARVAKGDSK